MCFPGAVAAADTAPAAALEDKLEEKEEVALELTLGALTTEDDFTPVEILIVEAEAMLVVLTVADVGAVLKPLLLVAAAAIIVDFFSRILETFFAFEAIVAFSFSILSALVFPSSESELDSSLELLESDVALL